jgi:hypothetical protein
LAVACFGVYDRAGAYIRTTGNAATVTDYTLGDAGVVTTGEMPLEGAVLDWSGSGR